MIKITKVHLSIFLTLVIEINSTFIDLNEVQKNILQWKNQNLLNFSEVGLASNGVFDLSDVKNKLIQWKTQKLAALCPTNGYDKNDGGSALYPKFLTTEKLATYMNYDQPKQVPRAKLQNLLNLVCSTAQPTNVTLRDACITCFSQVTSMPEGPQELNALSVCATQYFTNTSYASCATSLAAIANSALNVQPSGCFMGYCDFVRCLRRTNSNNLIIQCTREARTGVNITLDADNVRFFTNVTSCILARTRCSTFNPITGEPQIPGSSIAGSRISNALQFSDAGELRILAFAANTPVLNAFCATSTNLTQTSWLTNVC